MPPSAGRLPDARERLLLVVPLAAFVAATTHWTTWSEPIRLHYASDVLHYEKIAEAAPHFTWPQITGHISMWPVHYLVGCLSKLTHLPLHATYYVAAIALLAYLVYLVDRILVRLGVGAAGYAVAMGAALLNPYVFRYLALAPGMINDTVFITCVALAVVALLEHRTWQLVGALVVAALARGWSTPPLQLGAAAWILADRGVAVRRRRVVAAAALVLPLAAFAIAYWLGTTTPGHAQALKDCCGLTTITVVGDLAHLPGSAHALALHFARTAIGIAMPLAVLVAVAVVSFARRTNPLPRTGWWLLGLSAVLVAEPILLSSAWNEGAEPRLVTYSVVPLVAATALAVDRLELGRVETGVCLALFAVASLSHRFASVGPRTPGEFAALVFACAAAVVLLLAGRRLLPAVPAPHPDRHA